MYSPNEETSATTDPSSAPRDGVKLQREGTNSIAEAAALVADEVLEDEQMGNDMIAEDEASALKGLTENVRDQDDLERDITHQANLVMIEQEDERDQKRIDRVNGNIEKLDKQRQTQRRRLNTLTHNPLMRTR